MIHLKFFAFSVAAWVLFFVLGLPDYFQQYSDQLMWFGIAVSLLPTFYATVKYMLWVLPDDPRRASLWMAFYGSVPFFVFDWLYVGLYLREGLKFVFSYWYLTVYYILPIVVLPPVGVYLERKRSARRISRRHFVVESHPPEANS